MKQFYAWFYNDFAPDGAGNSFMRWLYNDFAPDGAGMTRELQPFDGEFLELKRAPRGVDGRSAW
ncbi:MAG: hypothetical protein EXS36_01500 [Pedosphaera sp.]|nr:hypothetical protein [Pedosphaera sp.]